MIRRAGPTRAGPSKPLRRCDLPGGAARQRPVPLRGKVEGLPGASDAIVSVAVRVPLAAGRNATDIEQVAPGARTAPAHELDTTTKSAGSAPCSEIALRCSVPLPLSVRVIDAVALWLPTRTRPNVTLPGCRETAPATPVPLSDTPSVPALPTAFSCPETAPAADGVKWTPTTQFAPGLRVAPVQPSTPTAKADEPAIATESKCTGVAPLSVSVTEALAVEPTDWPPKSMLAGETLTLGGVPLCWNSKAPRSTTPPLIRGRLSKSVAGREGA